MNYLGLDTPALIIDQEIMMKNIHFMQDYANRQGVNLRPHTKTHKMPRIAKIQEAVGAKGITVAKVGEAEVMAANGLTDIMIANQIVGPTKLHRVRKLAESIDVSFGIDSIEQTKLVEIAFADALKPAHVVIEIEVGEERSGVIEEEKYTELLKYLKNAKNIYLKGIFSHDGDSYGAENLDELKEIHMNSQKRTLRFAEIAKDQGFELEIVSIGSTPSLMHDFPILDGITEIRPGTYVFMDASMASAANRWDMNAVTILSTIISKPTDERIITDVGAKGLTMQTRTKGITATRGLGLIKGHPDAEIFAVYDEHAIIYNKELRDKVKVGDVLEFIPNHICPVVNLYENAYLVNKGQVVEKIPVECRGKLQ